MPADPEKITVDYILERINGLSWAKRKLIHLRAKRAVKRYRSSILARMCRHLEADHELYREGVRLEAEKNGTEQAEESGAFDKDWAYTVFPLDSHIRTTLYQLFYKANTLRALGVNAAVTDNDVIDVVYHELAAKLTSKEATDLIAAGLEDDSPEPKKTDFEPGGSYI